MEEVKSKEPKYSKFTQQELPACKPLLTPKWVILAFSVISVVFIPIGAICLSASQSVVEVSKRYDDVCIDATDNEGRENILQSYKGEGNACQIEIEIEEDMKSPVYLYYELHNFYQNHRRYVKSRSDEQLRGDNPEISGLKDCEPMLYLPGSNRTMPINPCGLIAWSYFNDTYALEVTESGGATPVGPLAIHEDKIAWKSDVDEKFGNYETTNFNTDPAHRGGGAITGPVEKDEHFIVWMRTAVLPNFRKLWGRIETDLKKGDKVKLNIDNRYNTYRFNGKKKVILSTASWLGGRNDFLGIAYLVVGCLCLVIGLVFFIMHQRNPRPLGDVSYLSWNKSAPAS